MSSGKWAAKLGLSVCGLGRVDWGSGLGLGFRA